MVIVIVCPDHVRISVHKELVAQLAFESELLGGFARPRIVRVGAVIKEYWRSRAQIWSPCLHLCDRVLTRVQGVDVQQIDWLATGAPVQPDATTNSIRSRTSGPTRSK